MFKMKIIIVTRLIGIVLGLELLIACDRQETIQNKQQDQLINSSDQKQTATVYSYSASNINENKVEKDKINQGNYNLKNIVPTIFDYTDAINPNLLLLNISANDLIQSIVKKHKLKFLSNDEFFSKKFDLSDSRHYTTYIYPHGKIISFSPFTNSKGHHSGVSIFLVGNQDSDLKNLRKVVFRFDKKINGFLCNTVKAEDFAVDSIQLITKSDQTQKIVKKLISDLPESKNILIEKNDRDMTVYSYVEEIVGDFKIQLLESPIGTNYIILHKDITN